MALVASRSSIRRSSARSFHPRAAPSSFSLRLLAPCKPRSLAPGGFQVLHSGGGGLRVAARRSFSDREPKGNEFEGSPVGPGSYKLVAKDLGVGIALGGAIFVLAIATWAFTLPASPTASLTASGDLLPEKAPTTGPSTEEEVAADVLEPNAICVSWLTSSSS